MGELFSKLRAGGLTVAEAVSLPRGAEALSFFATRDGAAVLVWGARDVIGTWLKKLFYLQYVQAAETDSPLSRVSGPIFKISQKAP
jgi:hypothetical protein